MSSLIAKYLQKHGIQHFTVASRDPSKAAFLAKSLKGKALAITDISQCLSEADIVISATACPLPFMTQKMVAAAMQQRNTAPMFLIDLAVPRDIEPEVSQVSCVHLFNIDDLNSIAKQGMDERKIAALHAEQLVVYELERYLRKEKSHQADGIICDYRAHMEDLAQQELNKALLKLSHGACHQETLKELTYKLVNKLSHLPTVGLRQAAEQNRLDLFELAQFLFQSETQQEKNHEALS